MVLKRHRPPEFYSSFYQTANIRASLRVPGTSGICSRFIQGAHSLAARPSCAHTLGANQIRCLLRQVQLGARKEPVGQSRARPLLGCSFEHLDRPSPKTLKSVPMACCRQTRRAAHGAHVQEVARSNRRSLSVKSSSWQLTLAPPVGREQGREHCSKVSL